MKYTDLKAPWQIKVKNYKEGTEISNNLSNCGAQWQSKGFFHCFDGHHIYFTDYSPEYKNKYTIKDFQSSIYEIY